MTLALWTLSVITCVNFCFKNTGTATLKITKDIEAICGCTIPKLEKMVYEPDETGHH